MEPWWAQTPYTYLWWCIPWSPKGSSRATLTHCAGGAHGKDSATNPEPKQGEEPKARRERRHPTDWDSVCGDINPRLITLRGRSMRSRITSLYPCVDAVYIQRVSSHPPKTMIENALEASVLKNELPHWNTSVHNHKEKNHPRVRAYSGTAKRR